MAYKKIKCPHNDAVECTPSTKCCSRCGWDPKVAESRKEKREKATKKIENRKKPEKYSICAL